MKKLINLIQFSLLALVFSCLLWQPARACVDYHSTVFITCHVDNSYSNIAIKVSNLRLFGGNPNDFCSCGITNHTDIFSNVHYIAFVDSGTTNPVPGFDVWTGNSNAGNAWESVLATGDWSGYISSVNNNGLTANGKVEVIIRASLPPGYSYSVLDSAISVSQIGTDEWSNTNQNLTASHQSITGFWTGGPVTYVNEGQNSTYFSDLDNAILLSAKAPEEVALLDVFPIPAVDQLYVQLKNPGIGLASARIYNAAGQLIEEISQSRLSAGRAAIDVSEYPEGIYFLKVRTDQGEQTKKFVHL